MIVVKYKLWKKSVWLYHRDALLHIGGKENKNFCGISKHDVGDVFSLQGEFYSCPQEGGFVVHALQPCGPRAAIFGGETITFQKELWGFSFDVVWGYCMVQCGRMLRARWSVYACECVCARCRACDMAGVHQSKGRRARRLAAPDSALQEGLVWWRAHSQSSIPQDKS